MSNRRKLKANRPKRPVFVTSEFVADDEVMAIMLNVVRSHPQGIEEGAMYDAVEQVETSVAAARLFLRGYFEAQQSDSDMAREVLAMVPEDALKEAHVFLHMFDHMLEGKARIAFSDDGFDFVAA
ncbi:MAG: hypothetical protein ACSLEW_11230 [Nocardioides sp.]